jgi:hypothetical protein
VLCFSFQDLFDVSLATLESVLSEKISSQSASNTPKFHFLKCFETETQKNLFSNFQALKQKIMPLKFLKKSRQYDVFSKDFNMFTIVCLGELKNANFVSTGIARILRLHLCSTLTLANAVKCVNLDQVFLKTNSQRANVL